MSDRMIAGLAVAAAILVLFSAMLEPWVSAAVAIAALLGFAAYSYFRR